MLVRTLLVYSLASVVLCEKQNHTEINLLGDYIVLGQNSNIVEMELWDRTIEIVLLNQLDLNSTMYEIKINKTCITITQGKRLKYRYQVPEELKPDPEWGPTWFNRIAVSWSDVTDCIVFEMQDGEKWIPLAEWKDRSAPKEKIDHFGMHLGYRKSSNAVAWKLKVPEHVGHDTRKSHCDAPRLSLFKEEPTDTEVEPVTEEIAIG